MEEILEENSETSTKAIQIASNSWSLDSLETYGAALNFLGTFRPSRMNPTYGKFLEPMGLLPWT